MLTQISISPAQALGIVLAEMEKILRGIPRYKAEGGEGHGVFAFCARSVLFACVCGM